MYSQISLVSHTCPLSATYKTESSHVARVAGSHRMVTAAGSSPALYQLSSPAAVPSSGATHLCSHHTIQHSVTVQTTTTTATKLETSRILFLEELQTIHQQRFYIHGEDPFSGLLLVKSAI